ncbi:receptor-type tyrosine-protein phosphatase eta-like [Polypterus senegalus]|uniref:receptor-type tyrosine-protein phosphatase eta-like n=1 Tax=Polypterus senegalus TaxID=55291 RepID=UPI001964B16B|nr:receptor-type tyrosine-protein phosphatase eta-like [Polypterus senegalus]
MAVLTGLTPGSKYTVQVFAVAEDNVTQGSGASLTVFTKPETILNLTAEDITTTSITLTWSSALSGVVHYKVKIPGTTLPDLTVYSETATISQLIPGRNYTVEVSAVDGDNFTEGDAASLTVSTVPGNILGLTAENITTKSFSLTWNLTEGVAVGYNVQVTGVPDFDTRVDSEMAVLTGLTPGSMYTVQVFAVAEDNVTQGSGASLTVFTKPETILNLTAEDITTTSITLTWSSALSGVVHYKVKIPGTTLPDLTVYSETATISQLIPGRNYTVEVSAVDGDNFTEGDAASLTVSTVPGNILGLTAENITTKSFSLTWNLTEGVAVGYNVQVTGVPDFDTRVDSEMAVLTGLTPGSMYTVQVFAVAEDNVTQGSGASLTVFTKPETILNLTAEDITTTSITLTWSSALSGVVHYKVKIPGTTLPDLTVYSETATISQLIPGGTTRWKYLLWMETTSLKAMLPLSRFPQEKSAKAALSLVAPFDDRSPQGRRNLPVP